MTRQQRLDVDLEKLEITALALSADCVFVALATTEPDIRIYQLSVH
jgi:hypothetical protein